MKKNTHGVKNFGLMLQNENMDNVISISWNVEYDEGGPHFHFFPKDLKKIVSWFSKHYNESFVIVDSDNFPYDLYTEDDTIFVFDDQKLEIKVINYKILYGVIYKFFSKKEYQGLKHEININSITFEEYYDIHNKKSNV